MLVGFNTCRSYKRRNILICFWHSSVFMTCASVFSLSPRKMDGLVKFLDSFRVDLVLLLRFYTIQQSL